MASKTGIAWCDSTFNPWIGCTKISPACDNCYAESIIDTRLHVAKWGAGQPRHRTSVANWKQVERWNAKPFYECEACGWRGEDDTQSDRLRICMHCGTGARLTLARRRVFCASLGDVFDNEVDPLWRADLFALIERTPNLDWLLLTKRIGNVERMTMDALRSMFLQSDKEPTTWPWPNIWLGTTVCNQEEADRDIPKLLSVPAAMRFLSIEPMLGQIDLTCVSPRIFDAKANVLTGKWKWNKGPVVQEYPPLDWVICGGESGKNARPMHPEWVRSLRDQCSAAGVPFFFKQWDGTKSAGRLLDGREHNEFPEAV
jgi:protein gp37